MSDLENLLGRVIAGKFELQAHIGAGAMGEVFRARHVVLDTAIALKIMRPSIAKDPMFKERFYREAKAASRLEHPNSVRVLDYGVEPDGLVYIAMEFLHGRDLLGVLRAEWPLSDAHIVDILAQTLGAVSMAHELGIIHRDLKPENIMVNVGPEDDDGQRPYHVKVCDFGIAKLSDPRGFQTDGQDRALTSSGALIGTPEYMSPEQARGDALDARSDIYSVGIILYQMLVGRVPFYAENALGVVLKQVTDQPIPPSVSRPHVNARLESICLRALNKSRDARYQTAREMRRDLRAALGSRPNLSEDSNPRLPAVDDSVRGVDLWTAGTMPTEALAVGSSRQGVPLAADSTAPEVERLPRRVVSVAKLGAGVAVLGLLVGALSVWAFDGARRTVRRSEARARVSLEHVPDSTTVPSAASAAAREIPSDPAGGAVALPVPTGPVRLLPATPAKLGGRAKEVPVARGSRAVPLPSAMASVSGFLPAPAPTAKEVVREVADAYNPASAYVALGPAVVDRIREDAVARKMATFLPKLSECYRSALMVAGAPVGGSCEIHMSIDERGAITAILNVPKLPQFARCAQQTLAGQTFPVSSLENPAGGATATQSVTLHP
jgi:serine/threonine-protein kinase